MNVGALVDESIDQLASVPALAGHDALLLGSEAIHQAREAFPARRVADENPPLSRHKRSVDYIDVTLVRS